MKSKRVLILVAVTFFAFLLRFFSYSRTILPPDACLYLSYAKAILKGKFSFDFNSGNETILPPLYSLLIAFFTIFTGNFELSGHMVSAIAGALLIIPVFYLTKNLYNETAAWLSTIFVLFSPLLIYWSTNILTEALFITLFVSGIAVAMYAMDKGKRTWLPVSGALIGLSYMTRVIGLTVIPVMGFCILFYFLRIRKRDIGNAGNAYKKAITSLAIFLLGFILVAGLYLVKLHSFYGNWTLAAGYGSIKGVISYEGAATSDEWESLATKQNEDSFLVTLLRKITVNFQNYSTSLLSMLFLIVIFIAVGITLKWKVLYIILFAAAFFSALLLQPLSPGKADRIRYLSPLLPILLMMASGGIIRMHEWTQRRFVKQAIIPVSVFLVFLSSIPMLQALPVHLLDKADSVNFRKDVGVWMDKNLPHPIRVMARKPIVPYYANAIWFSTPETYEEVIKIAASNEIDYIVIDRGVEYNLRPKLRFLFDPPHVPDALQLINGIRHPQTGELYIGIYKIKRG